MKEPSLKRWLFYVQPGTMPLYKKPRGSTPRGLLVGTTRFELATPRPPDVCATGLRYVPKRIHSYPDIKCQTTIQYPVSSIQYTVSSIQYPVSSKWVANIGGKRKIQVILQKIFPPLHEDTCKAGGYCRSGFPL